MHIFFVILFSNLVLCMYVRMCVIACVYLCAKACVYLTICVLGISHQGGTQQKAVGIVGSVDLKSNSAIP